MSSTNYYKKRFPSDVRIKLESIAFRLLCDHLRERSDDVQNIDLMIISGFCRNCLAKWLVVEARRLSKAVSNDTTLLQHLNAFGYDEAAEEIYGCAYPEWKKRHAKKASNEQVEKYKQIVDTPLHAHHDKKLLEKTQQVDEQNQPVKYYQRMFPQNIQEDLEAGTFRLLCQHLLDRSHLVSNIDLMTVSGFCRNCLAKWLVLAARILSKEVASKPDLQQSLDSFGYDEAAEEIYDCTYPEWKKRYATKATNEQMTKYEESSRFHAKHDKEMLKKRDTIPAKTIVKQSLMSNVCCENVDDMNPITPSSSVQCVLPSRDNAHRSISGSGMTIFPSFHSYHSIPPPQNLERVRIAILTVSDRAFHNLYSTGDLSGPAVKEAVAAYQKEAGKNTFSCDFIFDSIVPDEMDAIQSKLLEWSDGGCDVIFTTGGTGFSPRDVTPEATVAMLERECTGLMAWVSGVCSSIQPLAALSRGTAGIRNNTMIVNLPGNPRGVRETLTVLFPLVLHAVSDIIQQRNG